MCKSQEDAVSLKEDLDHFQGWETDWQMVFNPEKGRETDR